MPGTISLDNCTLVSSRMSAALALSANDALSANAAKPVAMEVRVLFIMLKWVLKRAITWQR
jgi:hypothetical protein